MIECVMSMQRLARILVACLLGATVVATGVSAQGPTSEAALSRLCSNGTFSADWFAPSLLSQVPLATIQRLFSNIAAEFGRCLRVTQTGNYYALIFEHGVFVATGFVLDSQGRIASLTGLPRKTFATLDEAAQSFFALPGQVSLVVLENDRPRVALNADTPLAIGSAFKLSVLTALREQIDAGRRAWNESVSLRAEWKSLPSGFLQTFPDNTGVSVRTLAQLMIAVSDNTATDVLIRLVGREAVEANAPPRNRPFLMTREAFILKDPKNGDLLERWRTGNEQARRKVLEDALTQPLPDLASFGPLLAKGPQASDVEWFYTVRELCALIDGVSDLTAMRINPGLTIRKEWAWVAFKGGSEPGVLNLTTQLESTDGRKFCASATWNNTTSLEDFRLVARYAGLLELLK